VKSNASFLHALFFVLLAGSSHSLAQVSYRAGSPTAPPRIVQTIDETNLVQLKGNTHPLANAEHDQGAVPDSLSMAHMLFELKRAPEQEQALLQLIDQMHDPHSGNYHKWLTAEELGRQFGPSRQDIDIVINWLRSQGFQINVVYPSGMVVDITGTAGQVRDTFHTEIHRYNVEGKQHIANASDPVIPAAVEPVVVGFASLHDFMPRPLARRPGTTQTAPAPQPDFSFPYNGIERYFVGPQDFAKIYNVTPLWTASLPITGKGQTIAVLENTDMNANDWTTFRTAFGLSSFSGTFAQVHPAPPTGTNNCNSPGTNSNEIEAAIDAEWTGAVAPDAAIELASCKDTSTSFGVWIAAQNLLNGKNPPPIISVSYGACESDLGSSGNAFFSSTWQQAVTEGTSVFVAAGDVGAAVCDGASRFTSPASHGIAVSGTASTPYNVAVGGTDFQDYADGTTATYWSTTNGSGGESAKSYVPEIPWNDSCAGSVLYTFEKFPSGAAFCNSSAGTNYLDSVAGSGGPSSIYPKPSWQSGVIGLHNDRKRDLPDVSLFASAGFWTHASLICMSDTSEGGATCTYTNPTDALLSSNGGTSLTAPAFAGIQALINEKTGSKQGNPNPVLYKLAAAEYGSSTTPNHTNLTSCNSNKGNKVGSSCIFYDITKGDIDVVCQAGSKNCFTPAGDSYGVLSTSTKSAAAAYRSGAGWDFATGLGTVNVTNLVNAW
jgi:subtilase family serine protease